MRAAIRRVALIVGLGLAAFSHAQSDDLQDISRLMKQGQNTQALERVNQYLATRPRDAQGRFLKGLILAEQNKVADAIDVFSKLSQDYPELPEPYNNLAVLYATQGQYEKARQALEMSIRTHPSYATAYENLGDVYAKLASQAYDKALQLDSTNAAAQTKLSLVREMISGTNRPARAGARSESTKAAEPPKSTLLAAAPKAGAASAPEARPAAEQKVPPETRPAPAAKAALPRRPTSRPKRAMRQIRRTSSRPCVPGRRPGRKRTSTPIWSSTHAISRRPTASRAAIGRRRADSASPLPSASKWPSKRSRSAQSTPQSRDQLSPALPFGLAQGGQQQDAGDGPGRRKWLIQQERVGN